MTLLDSLRVLSDCRKLKPSGFTSDCYREPKELSVGAGLVFGDRFFAYEPHKEIQENEIGA
jgi:hypothetical protein